MPGAAAPQEPRAAGSEVTPAEAAAARTAQAVVVITLGSGYIVVSAALIGYNKYLIHSDRFPFAVPLVFMHSVMCTVFAFITYLVKPSLFPALSDPARKIALDCDLFLKGAMPVAFFFSAQLALSNSAYLHSTVAFLQMMKEANLALVYTLSLVAALENFHWRSAVLLIFVVIATAMTIHGEINFDMTGFALQGTSQLFECTKIVLQAMLLSSSGRKLDALTYVLLVMPCCAFFLGSSLVGIHLWSPHRDHIIPPMELVCAWWPHLLASSCVAFLLNIVVALFVKHSSAVSFILCGMVKDAMIVLSGVFILNEAISRLQAFGFALQLWFIMLYTLVKTFPREFEHGLADGMFKLFVGDSLASPKKAAALVPPAGAKDYGALAEAGALVNEARCK